MALNHDARAVTNSLTQTVEQRIQRIFPIEGKQNVLEVEDVRTDPRWRFNDVDGFLNAKLKGRTWGAPITGTLVLRDKQTGKVLDRKQGARLMTLPTMTQHFSFIVEGKEYNAVHQWRLKAGVYHRVKDNGELEAQWNLAKGRGFRTAFDPKSHKFTMKYGSTTVPLYPVLRAMGVGDAEITKAWGNELTEMNKATSPRDLVRLYRAIKSKSPADETEMVIAIRDTFNKTEMRADVNQQTLGRPDTRVTGGGLLASSGRLLNIARGKGEPDPRDSTVFKELLSIDDHVDDRLNAMTYRIQGRVKNRLDRENKIDHIYSAEYMNHPVRTFFTSMSLSEQPRQINPIDMFSSTTKTTIMGEGGIQSTHGVPLESRLLDNSHAGILDPLHTPEGDKVGVNLNLALGAGKQGREPTTIVRNLKTGKFETHMLKDLAGKTIAFPDQFIRRPGGQLQPVGKEVSVLDREGQVVKVPVSEVEYVMPSSNALFSVTGNLVPFIQNTSGPRVSYAMHHMEQALSLKHREKPLIAVATGEANGKTFEDIVGGYFTSKAPVDGKVLRVTEDFISIRGTDGKLYKESLYNNYPLNEKSAFINSEPTVKPGDTVTKGQVISDTNHTVNGQLAMGVNLKVGYMPYLSSTYDDAIVISESASQKLTSQHLYKERMELDDENIVSKSKYRAMYRDRMDDRQASQLGNDGVVLEGTTVQPGDVLIAGLRKRTPTEEDILVRGISKSLSRPYADSAVRWESQYPGVVERVVHNGSDIQVHIASEEPAGVGDKLCYDAETEFLVEGKGWVRCGDVKLDDKVLSYVEPDIPSRRRSTAAGHVEWAKPTRLIEYYHSGYMYKVATPHIDQFVTPNHKLYVKVFDEVPEGVRQRRYRLVQAQNVVGKPLAFAQYGANPEMTSPDVITYRGREFPTSDFMEVLTYVYKYGVEQYDTVWVRGGGYTPTFTKALDACGVDYTIRTVDNLGGVLITDPVICGLDIEHDIPSFVDTLPTEVIGNFLTGVFRQLPFAGVVVGTALLVTKSLLGRFQELGVRGRVAFTVGSQTAGKYPVHLAYAESTCGVLVTSGEMVKYQGKVYCCTVPSGILVTRRNFKVSLSGNSGRHGNKGVVSCYDDQTEILTDSGWKLFKDLNKTEKVASLDSATGVATFQTPTAYFDYPYEGELLGCKHRYLDYLVTPNHRMLVRIEHYRGETAQYSVREAAECHGKALVHKSAVPFERVPTIGETYTLPVERNGRGRQCNLTFDSLAFYEFMGWYLSEGNVASYTSDTVGATKTKVRSYKVQISQSREVNPENCRLIEECLTRMGVGWYYSGMQYTFSHKALYTYLKSLGISYEKYIPEELFGGSDEALHALLDAFMLGDGKQYGPSRCGQTTSKRLVDDLQRVATILGKYATTSEVRRSGEGRKCYRVVVRDVRGEVGTGRVRNTYYTQEYSGHVYCVTVPGGFVYVRRNGKPFWSGNSVVPDEMMPRTKDGPMDIILNPLGIPSRINVGTVLETSLSKVADKEGQQIAISNFEPDSERRLVRKTITVAPHKRTIKRKDGSTTVIDIEGYTYERDVLEQVEEELAAAGISEKEEVFDPVTGKSVGDVLVGFQYIVKHVHQAEKKLAARSGGPGYDYDANMSPKGSGSASGQRMGELGLYALLNHGALSLIREGQTFKSDASQNEVWTALQTGEPLPPPKPSFAYGKFLALLGAMGVATDKSGSQINLRPMTDEDVVKQSSGELKDSTLTLRAKDLKPEPGGLFDERITGGLHGDKWCFAGDTLVLTEFGPMRIDTIVENCLSIRVWSYDFTRKCFVLKPIKSWYQRENFTEATGYLRFTSPDGKPVNLHGTAKHEIMTAEGGRRAMRDSVELLCATQESPG